MEQVQPIVSQGGTWDLACFLFLEPPIVLPNFGGRGGTPSSAGGAVGVPLQGFATRGPLESEGNGGFAVFCSTLKLMFDESTD